MLVCIDFDGVIVDSIDQQLDVVVCAQRALGAGRVPQLSDFHTIENLSPLGFAEHIGIPVQHHEAWCSQVQHAMQHTTIPAGFFPDAVNMIERIAARHAIVIISSNVREVIERELTAHGVRDAVQRIYDCRMPGSKADKMVQASAELEYASTQVVMIGDTRSDIRHAKEAGVRAIAVTWGYQSAEVLALEQPDFIARSVAHLYDHLAV